MKTVAALALSLFLFILGSAPAGAAPIPPTLAYSTPLGGPGQDVLTDIAVDSAGNAYVLIYFNTLPGGYFLVKLDSMGGLVFKQLLEMPHRKGPRVIALDPQGYIYIAGTWSADTGVGKGFVTKLTPDGIAIHYDTLFSDRENDGVFDLAVDASGQAYVVSRDHTTYPVSSEVYRLSPTGELDGGTGGGPYYVNAMAVGPDGDLFTLGWVDFQAVYLERKAPSGEVIETVIDETGALVPLGIAGFPDGGSVVVGSKGGLYVARFGPAGEEVFSRVLNLGAVEVRDIAVTSSGEIVLAGYAGPASLPDAIVLRLDGRTGEVLSSAAFGGSGEDFAEAVAVDSKGDAYAAGTTLSSDFPTVNPIQPVGGYFDGFVARISKNRRPDCSGATASPSTIWPPDRRQVRISTRVPDADGDSVTLKVTRILQDELFTARMADAGGLGTAKPWVRADRMDTGDGRVYHLFFEATDPSGAKCTGEVKVCVPLLSGGTCRDGGARIDSTLPR